MICCKHSKHSQNGARFFLHRHILLPSAFWDFPWRGGEMPGAGACLFSLVWITKAFNLDWLLNL